MAEVGWIRLHRKIQECFIWEDRPYDKARAWIDLLLLATHRDKKMLIDGKIVVIERGSFMTSRIKLAERWGWSNKKVDAYLKLLENEKMVTTVRTPKGTTLTIVKYDDYQVWGTTEDTTEGTTEGTTEEIAEDTTEDTAEDTQNNNIKNIKKVINNKKEKELSYDNSKKKKFEPPSVFEVQEYCFERNNNIDAQAFVDFYESKGWMVGKTKMKDWKAAVRTWERNRPSNNYSNKATIDWSKV